MCVSDAKDVFIVLFGKGVRFLTEESKGVDK